MSQVLGFTGTQQGVTHRQRSALRGILLAHQKAGAIWLHHGDCIGSDAQAASEWSMLGGVLHCHPPTIDAKRAFVPSRHSEPPKPYLVRNRVIVDRATHMVATPAEMDEQQRGGTWSTIRYARRLSRPLQIILPDGSVMCENW